MGNTKRRLLPLFTCVALILAAPPAQARPDAREQAARNAKAAAIAGVSNEDYVKELYRTLLGREADPDGLAGYVGELDKGALSRIGVRLDILKSAEYRKRAAQAKAGGDASSKPALPATPGAPPAVPPADPAVPAPPGAAVTKDGKPVSAADDTKAYVAWLYKSVLKRNPDAGGLQSHVDHILSGGSTREQKLKDFLASDEYKTRTAAGEIPPYDPAKAGDYRATLDDLFAGWTQTGGPSDATGARQPEEFQLPEKESGAVEFETSGIAHQDNDGPKGGDFWFFVMEGDFGQVRLQHTAGTLDDGTKRGIRYYYKPRKGEGRMGIEVASDNLPDWHTWRVEWAPDRLTFFLDGNCIGEEKGISLKPKRVMIGGYVGGGRNFKGNWRNFRAR